MLFSYEQLKEISGMTLANRQKFVDNSDVTLGVYENAVEVSSDSSAVTVTLPDVGRAMGLLFDINCPDTATNDVTVNDANGTTVQTIGSVSTGYITLMSTGRNWRTLAVDDGT